MPVIGFLHSGSPSVFSRSAEAFRNGLAETGHTQGQSVIVEYHWAEGQFNRLPEMAADLVRRQVAVIFAGGPPAALAAKAATSTIPIVFAMGDDPVTTGLVASLNRPGGNITGATFFTFALGAKRLELLHELVPRAATIALILNPKSPNAEAQRADAEASAAVTGRQLHVLNASTDHDIDLLSEALLQLKPDALLVGTDPFFTSQRNRLVSLASQRRIAAIYSLREYATAGGLMSYGASAVEAHRLAGVYAGRVLKGVRPADIPVEQPTKFELVINLKTAKALGLEIPPTLLARADEVIE